MFWVSKYLSLYTYHLPANYTITFPHNLIYNYLFLWKVTVLLSQEILLFTYFKLSFKLNNESESCSVVSNSLRPQGLYSPWNSLGQNTGVGSLSLLQGIFPTQKLSRGLLHCRQILYQLSYQGSPDLKIKYDSVFTIPK